MLSLAADVLRRDRGRITLDGHDPSASTAERKRFRQNVAWLPQQVGYFTGLNVREHVAYVGWLKGLSRRAAWSQSMAALEPVGLADKRDCRVKTLSGGQLRRLGIAGALVHDADVLLLDEPTAGLDPNQRNRFRGILMDLPESVHAVVSTHQIEDVHDIFDRIVVLDHGDIVFSGTVPEFLDLSPESGTMPERVSGAYAALIGEEA